MAVYESETERQFRQRQRSRAIVKRGGYRRAICDLCGQHPRSGVQYHEIINRGRTMYNEQARSLSYSEELCAVLCSACHESAHNPKVATALLAINIKRYGRMAVQVKYDTLEGLLPGPLSTSLPDMENDND